MTVAEVLPLCARARSLDVSRNPRAGHRGIAAIAGALATGAAPCLREVNVQQIASAGVGASAAAMRSLSRVRDVLWYA